MKYQEVKAFCELKGYTHRKDRYKIMQDYFGISAGDCENIIKFDRQLRNVIPADEKGEALEKLYHTPDYIWNDKNCGMLNI